MNLLNTLKELESLKYQRNRRGTHPKNERLKVSSEMTHWLDLTPQNDSKTLIEALYVRLQYHQIEIQTINSCKYPKSLYSLSFPPKILFTRGRLAHLQKPTIGIIGRRKPSLLAAKMAWSLGEQGALSGFSIISGLATGIDTAALKGAASACSNTPAIAVLGTAITRCYPARNYSLFTLLAKQGCLISEYPPWFKTCPFHFILRNDLIAALSDALIVVEAVEKSGTFYTVNTALELGKPIFVMDLPAKGNQRLIQEGAQCIRQLSETYAVIFDHLRSQSS